MKTIIVKSNGDREGLLKFISKLEKYTDFQIKDACIRTVYLGNDNFNTVAGEMKDAVNLNDYDLFLCGVVDEEVKNLDTLRTINRAHTFMCELSEYDSAKNYVIMN